jgi:hypothetical protein
MVRVTLVHSVNAAPQFVVLSDRMKLRQVKGGRPYGRHEVQRTIWRRNSGRITIGLPSKTFDGCGLIDGRRSGRPTLVGERVAKHQRCQRERRRLKPGFGADRQPQLPVHHAPGITPSTAQPTR